MKRWELVKKYITSTSVRTSTSDNTEHQSLPFSYLRVGTRSYTLPLSTTHSYNTLY